MGGELVVNVRTLIITPLVKFLPIGLMSKEPLMVLQNKASLDPEYYPQCFPAVHLHTRVLGMLKYKNMFAFKCAIAA